MGDHTMTREELSATLRQINDFFDTIRHSDELPLAPHLVPEIHAITIEGAVSRCCSCSKGGE